MGFVSAVRINEVEMRPLEGKSGIEWVELYNENLEELDLSEWEIWEGISGSSGPKKINNFPEGAIIQSKGYYTFNFSNKLNDGGDFVILKDSSGNDIDRTPTLNETKNEDLTWQYCNGEWDFFESSKGYENNCVDGISTENISVEENEIILEETFPSIKIDYPESISVEEEFIFKIKLINFSEGKYDVKIDIFSDGVRIAKILNDDMWKSTIYYINDAIQNNDEEEFSMKIIQDFENAKITISIKDSKDKIKSFGEYEISKSDETFEEDETENKIIESFAEKAMENISLEPIILNAQNIKSEEDKKFSVKNLALYGVMLFCVVFGALFFLNKRKYKNEFQ